MTVSELGENKIRVSLTDTEVLCCFGNYERLFQMTDAIKSAFNALLIDIIKKHSSVLGKGRVIVQIKAQKSLGCEIILTCAIPKRKLLKKEILLEFSDSESLIHFILYLYRKKRYYRLLSSVYKLKNSYFLIISHRNCNELLYSAKEFCRKITEGGNKAEFIKEYGKPIILNNAIEEFGKYFSKEP